MPRGVCFVCFPDVNLRNLFFFFQSVFLSSGLLGHTRIEGCQQGGFGKHLSGRLTRRESFLCVCVSECVCVLVVNMNHISFVWMSCLFGNAEEGLLCISVAHWTWHKVKGHPPFILCLVFMEWHWHNEADRPVRRNMRTLFHPVHSQITIDGINVLFP